MGFVTRLAIVSVVGIGVVVAVLYDMSRRRDSEENDTLGAEKRESRTESVTQQQSETKKDWKSVV